MKQSFPRAKLVTERFHVQPLVARGGAGQTDRVEASGPQGGEHTNETPAAGRPSPLLVYENGAATRQLLARSRYRLFKPQSTWHDQQKARADILFREYLQLKVGYDLSMLFRAYYEHNTSIHEARKSSKRGTARSWRTSWAPSWRRQNLSGCMNRRSFTTSSIVVPTRQPSRFMPNSKIFEPSYEVSKIRNFMYSNCEAVWVEPCILYDPCLSGSHYSQSFIFRLIQGKYREFIAFERETFGPKWHNKQ